MHFILHIPKNWSPKVGVGHLNTQSNDYKFANVNDPLESNPHLVTHLLLIVSPKYWTVVLGQFLKQTAIG